MSLMDIVAELLEDSQEIRPNSPSIRPAEKPAIKGFSPQSPHSPPRDLKTVKKALGYGCAGCGCKTYQLVVNGWECENCKAVFEIIGGSKGPVLIQ